MNTTFTNDDVERIRNQDPTPILTLGQKVEQLQSRANELDVMLGETIATIVVNLDRGTLRACSVEAERHLRQFLETRSRRRQNLS